MAESRCQCNISSIFGEIGTFSSFTHLKKSISLLLFFRGEGGGGGCNCHIKNKLKSERFNDKKSLQAKTFFSVITKNSSYEILPKNLVTFKR